MLSHCAILGTYHFISQDAIETILIERDHPVETSDLVVPHLSILYVYIHTGHVTDTYKMGQRGRGGVWLTPGVDTESRDRLSSQIVFFEKFIVFISFTEPMSAAQQKGE